MVSFLGRLLGKGKKDRVSVTSVNIRFLGNSHGMDGMKIDKDVFEMSIPFQNKMGSGLLPDNLKGPKMSIGAITVAAPFTLVDVNPKPPIELEFMSRVLFKLKIKAPQGKYEGPLSITFGSETSDNVVINIKKVTLTYNEMSMALEDSSIGATMKKGQLFKENIQVYKVMSYGDTINGVEVSKPFEIVSTDPVLPAKADRKDSYILGLYLKCPDHSYAGDLEIKFR